MSLDHLDSSLNVRVGQYSSAGVKEVNEDAIAIRIPSGNALTTKGVVAVIADGVSASEGGREASNTAATSFVSDYYSTHDTWSVETSGSKVLTALNKWLYGQGLSYLNPEKGYITTFSALVLKSASAYIFHVGDSRIYRIRGGDIEQITRDHTMVVGKGQRYLARALGIDIHLDVDFHRLDLDANDIYVLTTDGIHDWINDKDILAALSLSAEPSGDQSQVLDNACAKIAATAAARGSDDNLSIQAVHVVHPGNPLQADLLASVSRLPFPPPLTAGMAIDGWRVISEVHASTRSEVYLVENEENGRRAVLKAPSANFEDDPAYIERFILEEWVGSRINSSNVVAVVRTAARKTFLYYLTDYVSGPTLGQLLRERTQLSVVDAQNIITQVISGLRAFHRRDVLHQDIKPDNIIYSENGVKIIDFGSCHISGVGEIKTRINREKRLGTRDYCAPEYLLNAPISARSDQFSLGVLLYELLTGKLPFGDNYRKCSSEQDFSRLLYTPSYQLNSLVPVWLDGAIQRALSIDPDDRYEALTEFAADIKKPNPAYEGKRRYLSHRKDNVFLWKALVVVLVLTNLITLLLLSQVVEGEDFITTYTSSDQSPVVLTSVNH
jgi:serine/threonine protein kinase/serine/threonine protein phosphatase PrpC